MFNYKVIINKGSDNLNIEQAEIFDLNYTIKSRNDSLVLGDKSISVLLGIKFLNDPNDKTIRENSKKKLKEIFNWSKSIDDYRKIIIQEILTEDEIIEISFEGMYIEEITKKYNVENIGEYLILLKQKILQNNKIKIE
ncbi:hypothetical protein [Streptobacillus canis]|uniref:hypothetical protein n=1 Tax=Streptobacillus canis TaxID=2678686 RepID=UPI0012E2408E|nr:hypothetical protein [Streptobacillus canis]